MLGSVVLDVAIGMVFVYLLLSLIASAIQELLATIVQARPANLLRGILSLFSGGKLDGSILFVQGIYQHGLVQGLYRDDAGDFASNPPALPKATGAQPAVSLANTAATLAMMNRSFLQRLMRMAQLPHFDWIKDMGMLPAYIPSRTFALALIDLLNTDKRSGVAMVMSVHSYLQDARQNHPGDKAIEALLALSLDAGDSLAKLQTNVENWYNDGMDRASGWYKKNTQYILLWVGLLLAVAFNVNSIEVAQTLWLDRDVRQSMVDAASKMNTHDTGPAAQTTSDLTAKLANNIYAFHNASGPLLPVGWTRPMPPPPPGWNPQLWPFWHAVAVGVGWIITALAISLGAPFWFDTLNKFMVVRGTIKPQEKSRTEGSKDPTPSPASGATSSR